MSHKRLVGSSSRASEPAQGELVVSEYSPKSVVVRGDTITHSDALTTLGGKFNPSLRGGAGFIFSKTREPSIKKYIDSGEIEPYVFSGNYQKKPVVSNEKMLRKLFRELRGAFDADTDYEGSAVINVLYEFEELYLKNDK